MSSAREHTQQKSSVVESQLLLMVCMRRAKQGECGAEGLQVAPVSSGLVLLTS
jgi:hypothetical protein